MQGSRWQTLLPADFSLSARSCASPSNRHCCMSQFRMLLVPKHWIPRGTCRHHYRPSAVIWSWTRPLAQAHLQTVRTAGIASVPRCLQLKRLRMTPSLHAEKLCRSWRLASSLVQYFGFGDLGCLCINERALQYTDLALGGLNRAGGDCQCTSPLMFAHHGQRVGRLEGANRQRQCGWGAPFII